MKDNEFGTPAHSDADRLAGKLRRKLRARLWSVSHTGARYWFAANPAIVVVPVAHATLYV